MNRFLLSVPGLRELAAECRGLEGLGIEAIATRIERLIETLAPSA